MKFNKSSDDKKHDKNYPGITDVCQGKGFFTESPIGLEFNMTIEHYSLSVWASITYLIFKPVFFYPFRGAPLSYDKFTTPNISSYQSPAGTQSNVGSQVSEFLHCLHFSRVDIYCLLKRCEDLSSVGKFLVLLSAKKLR